MKKLIIFLLIFIMPLPILAKSINTDIVTLSKCVDGDTARFILNDEEIKVRFLAIDTPETVHPTKDVELYGKDASEYTCKELTNAKKIELEYDPESDKVDKYGRVLAWIYVDDELLQKQLIEIGYAKVAYLYGDYLYTEELQLVEKEAKDNKLGIWNEEELSNASSDKEETKTATSKTKKKGIFETFVSFIDEIFEKLLELIDSLIEDVL